MGGQESLEPSLPGPQTAGTGSRPAQPQPGPTWAGASAPGPGQRAGWPRRTIAHVDMDAFFAAIEIRERPELAGRPVIVGGHRESRRGVVATCSYEARRYGVRSAMPIRRAVELCPHGVFLPGRMELYREVSRRIFAVLERFTPLIEAVSIDEAYLDVTADVVRYPDLQSLGRAIKQAIREAERLPCTVGIAPNKFLAKLATELAKPDGLRVITPEQADELLAGLELSRLPGVGPRTSQRLRELGLATVADVRRHSRSQLAGLLGRVGEWLWQLAWRFDPRPVVVSQEARSISAEETFQQDLTSRQALLQRLLELSAEVGRRLREEGYWARSITLKARYADFLTVTRRETLPAPTADEAAIYEVARRLMERVPPRPGGFRLLGVAAGSLTRFSQPELWDGTRGRHERVAQVVDAINRRYGRTVLARGQLFRGLERRRPGGTGADG